MVALRDVLPGRLGGRCLWSREVGYPGTGGWRVRVLGGSRAGAGLGFVKSWSMISAPVVMTGRSSRR